MRSRVNYDRTDLYGRRQPSSLPEDRTIKGKVSGPGGRGDSGRPFLWLVPFTQKSSLFGTLGTHLHIGPEGTHISGLNGQFTGIGSLTGAGDVSASHQLNFHMVAHVARDGAMRFGLNHVGLRNLPNDVPFQVVGTTSIPVIIPDLSGMAKSTGKATAKERAANSTQRAAKKSKI